MKFIIDHDLHLHSQLSSCSRDPKQTAQALLQYGKENGLKHICITDHFWDETVPGASGWYEPQNYAHVSKILPLPTDGETTVHFGCETDMDRFLTLGISLPVTDRFEFIIVPVNHLHMNGFTVATEDISIKRRGEVFLSHAQALLSSDLPFHKIGLAHFTCGLMARGCEGSTQDIINSISNADLHDLFTKAAERGIGIELNMASGEAGIADLIRPYHIAKDCGCKFYLGSDAHHPKDLRKAMQRFTEMIDALDLTEDDKFRPFG